MEDGARALEATQAAVDVARDAIAYARSLRDELLVLASHDIKNAVGIVDSALGMLEEMPEQAAQMQGMMRRATHRLLILVQAMVDVDLLQRDLMPLVPVDTSWGAVVTPVVEASLVVGATKEIAVVPAGDQSARLRCDATLVGRMLAALVEHAIGSAPAKSVVQVSGATDGDRFVLRVTHRGRAVGAATLDNLFTTLPLRFCRLAAVRHGGSLWAESPVADGQGVALALALP